MGLILSLAVVTTGTALIVAGATWLLGPWALIVSGIVLVAAGLLIDWEVLGIGKPAGTSQN